MKTLRIIYHMRLGDVVRCLPIAKYFADRGWYVELETLPEYHGVQDLVSYCALVPPGLWTVPNRKLDLQVWPRRAPDFEASGLTWQQYVYRLFPEGAEIDPLAIVFDRLPKSNRVADEALCFLTGYSQRCNPPEERTLYVAHKLFPGVPVLAIGPNYHMEKTVFDYARRVQEAAHVLTINSSASIICSAVRESWHHVVSKHPNEEWVDPRQIRVAIQ